jgi:hypothetical protein
MATRHLDDICHRDDARGSNLGDAFHRSITFEIPRCSQGKLLAMCVTDSLCTYNATPFERVQYLISLTRCRLRHPSDIMKVMPCH